MRSMMSERPSAMRIKIALAAMGALLATSGSAQAATGECAVTLSQYEIDYGTLQRGEGRHLQNTPLVPRQVSVDIHCPDMSSMGLWLDGEEAPTGEFRFSNAGRLNVTLKNASIDGRPVQLILTGEKNTPSAPSGPQTSLTLSPGQGVLAVDGSHEVKGKSFRVTAEIRGEIEDSAFSVRKSSTLENIISFTYRAGA